jgi:hypothetical protein
VTLANRAALFGFHIAHFIHVRSQKQMIRVDAKADVALMANVHFCG